jgi:hypothetical protein
MSRTKDFAFEGIRRGTLTIMRRSTDRRFWVAKCDCGAIVEVLSSKINEGNRKSCSVACPIRESKRARLNTPTFLSWRGIFARCENPNATGYRNYGGRGIRVCDRWRDFEDFVADVGERPSMGHSLDRIDVNGHYEPGNCRWATHTDQARNRRNALAISRDQANEIIGRMEHGETAKQVAARFKMSANTITAVFAMRSWL